MIDLDVDSLPLLMRALSSQVKGFDKAVRKYPNAYIFLGNQEKTQLEQLTPETQMWQFGHLDQIYVVPEVEGGTGIEVVYGFFIAAGYSTVAAVAITAVIYVGAFYVVSQLLAPAPITGGTKADENKSTLFDGVSNNTRPGGAIPIVYGIHTVGSTVLATDLETVDIPYTPPTPPPGAPEISFSTWNGNDSQGGA